MGSHGTRLCLIVFQIWIDMYREVIADVTANTHQILAMLDIGKPRLFQVLLFDVRDKLWI